mmetsp:Transcript_1792/g.3957  ORF Transcript_1792/g.3957 Transcript_1792/m.3957 type:complete len:227 (-) Transcript_1792:83-763(-)
MHLLGLHPPPAGPGVPSPLHTGMWPCLSCIAAPPAPETKSASKTDTCECWSWCAAGLRKRRRMEPRPFWKEAPRRDSRCAAVSGTTASPGASTAAAGGGSSTAGTGARGLGVATQDIRLPCGLLQSQVSDLLDRELTPNDYEMLLQLDESVARPTASRKSVESLTAACSEDFLGETCAVCLHAFDSRDAVVVLQCKHLFHHGCISKWLLERCRSCPLCFDEACPAV